MSGPMNYLICLIVLGVATLQAKEAEEEAVVISQCRCPTAPVNGQLQLFHRLRLRHRRESKNTAQIPENGKNSSACNHILDNVIRDVTRAKNYWLSSEVAMQNDLRDLKDRMERLVSLNERAVAEAEADTVHVHIFKIQGFNGRKQRGDVASAEYYTSQYGYKFESTIYVDGKGRASGTHISLTVAVGRGEWDDVLPWPVTVNFTISILDQRETRDKYHFTRYVNSTVDHQPIAIDRPPINATDAVIVVNLEKFALHSDLLDHKDLYILEDTVFVKIKITVKREEDRDI